MRFFHRKHQCYIVGEGSFAGRHGHLPEIDKGQDSESDTTEQLLQSTLKRRSKSLVPLGPKSPILKLKVKADMEPAIVESSEFLLPDPQSFWQHEGEDEPPFVLSPTPARRRNTLPEQLPPVKMRRQSARFGTLKDDVVSEDGMSVEPHEVWYMDNKNNSWLQIFVFIVVVIEILHFLPYSPFSKEA